MKKKPTKQQLRDYVYADGTEELTDETINLCAPYVFAAMQDAGLMDVEDFQYNKNRSVNTVRTLNDVLCFCNDRKLTKIFNATIKHAGIK